MLHMLETREICSVLVAEPEGKIVLGGPGHRQQDVIEMDLTATGWESVGWICLIQTKDNQWAVVNSVMNMQVHIMWGID